MIYTIGHSTLEVPEFLKLISSLATVVDVRSHPGSVHPQFNKQEMEIWMRQAGKGYVWEPRLGGWRDVHLPLAQKFAAYGVDVWAYSERKFPKQRIAMKRTGREPSWTNVGLYDYSLFMTLPEFHDAIMELIERGKREDVAIMCCEALWWKCHRSMIADYLYFLGHDTIHLSGRQTKTLGYRLSEKLHSTAISNRIERYEPDVLATWHSWLQQDLG